MIEIDGATGESGGQIIRTAMTLSAITQKPVHIFNIRAGRPNPGLQAQHLTAVKAVRNICRGTLSHAEVGSTELTFEPGEIVGGKYEFNIGTAGSVTLVAQTVLPVLLFASKTSEIKIIGGTHVIKSPGYDYFENIFLKAMNKIGVKATAKLDKTGFYPKGGGEITMQVEPSKPIAISKWERDEHVEVIIRLAGLPTGIAIREKKIFVQNNIEHIHVYEDQALSLGNAITAWRGHIGSYALGEKGKRAEEVAQECINELDIGKQIDVDKHLADQLLIYAALAEGETVYETSEITEHTRTNAGIIGKFIDKKIDITDNLINVS